MGIEASCLITGLARGADPSLPAIIDYTDAAPDAARAGEQLVLLHNWPGTLVFGFDGRGRPLVYDSTRLVFEVHDLAAPDVPARGWKNPDADTVISGGFSPDRRTLATVHSAGNRESRVQARQSRIRLWNIETGEPIERVFTPSDAGYVAFSADSKSLFGAALDSSGRVTVWDVASGEIRHVLSLPPPQPHFSYSGVHFSPTGRHLAARINFGGAYSLWEVETWRPAVESSQPVVCIAVSPDWKAALAADIPGVHGLANIRLVGLPDPGTQAKAPAPLPAETEKTLIAGAFSPDGRRLAYSHLNGAVRLWEVATGRVESTLAVNAGTVLRMGFSPDGRRLMTYGLPPGRSPGEVQLWDVAARRPLGMPESVPGIFWDFQFDPDSRYLVVSFLPGDDRIHAKVWRLPAEDAPPSAPPPKPNAGAMDVRDVGFKTQSVGDRHRRRPPV
jgi:WD40 repeat protein